MFSRRPSQRGDKRDQLDRVRNAAYVSTPTFGRLFNLSHRGDELDGAIGVVDHYDVTTGRFVFSLPTGEELRVRAHCMQAVSEELARSLWDGESAPTRPTGGKRAAIESRELHAASISMLVASPVRPRRLLAGKDDESGLRMLANGRLVGEAASHDEVALRSTASKEGPPRPWEMRPQAAHIQGRPPPSVRTRPVGAASGTDGQDVMQRLEVVSPLAARLRRRAPHAVQTEAYAIWHAEGMPEPTMLLAA